MGRTWRMVILAVPVVMIAVLVYRPGPAPLDKSTQEGAFDPSTLLQIERVVADAAYLAPLSDAEAVVEREHPAARQVLTTLDAAAARNEPAGHDGTDTLLSVGIYDSKKRLLGEIALTADGGRIGYRQDERWAFRFARTGRSSADAALYERLENPE